ncbi:hypothetical protein [Streptomyces sp. NPDC002088]|uniref:hypothetical protein n=1 Tax=Streptomyces sp. NPDC002088 TaxID=3154665 RepID=UPI003326889A
MAARVIAAVDGGPGTDEAQADSSTSASPEEAEETAADPTDAASADEGTGDDLTDDATDDSTGSATPPDATGFAGQRQDDSGKTLTIGEKYTSGEFKGKYAISYIEPGGDGILTGLGLDRSDGSFRVALKPISSDTESDSDVRAATLTRSGDDVDVTWDDGGRDILAWVE